MDALEGSDDYYLDVAVVDLSDKQEREQNVFLNNIAAQGSWNLELLGEMFRSDDLDLDATGFDPTDLQVILDDPAMATEFLPESDAAKEQGEQIVDIKDKNAALRKKKKDWMSAKDAERSTDNHLVIVLDNGEEVSAMLAGLKRAGLGVDDSSKFIDGRPLARLLDIELPAYRRPVKLVDHAAAVANRDPS